jgi:hypothetical protein
MKTTHFTSYISRLADVRGKLKKVHYRGKNPNYPTSNYFFSFENDSGNTTRIFWNNGISEAWLNRWFTPNPCNYCDDIFAECADVAFMDAWLPEYSDDRKGTNIVIVRSQLAHDIIYRGIKDNEISLEPISIEKVVLSQAGVIDVKRQHLAYQLYLGHQEGLKIPEKRIVTSKLSDPFLRQEIFLKNKMQVLSREIWDPKKQNADQLRAEMRPYLAQLARWNRFSRILKIPLQSLPRRIIGSLIRRVKGVIH